MKVGFSKAILVEKDLSNELIKPEIMPDDSWYESLKNEQETGVFELNISREYRESQEKYDQEYRQWQHREQENKNNSKLIFVRAYNYMSVAETRRNMYFYNLNNEKVNAIQAFPVRENMLEDINRAFARDGVIFKALDKSQYRDKIIYALDWDCVNAYVAHQIVGNGLFKEAITQDTPPILYKYKKRLHSSWYWKPTTDFWGCEDGDEYLTFHINYQVLISDSKITEIKDY